MAGSWCRVHLNIIVVIEQAALQVRQRDAGRRALRELEHASVAVLLPRVLLGRKLLLLLFLLLVMMLLTLQMLERLLLLRRRLRVQGCGRVVAPEYARQLALSRRGHLRRKLPLLSMLHALR